MPSLELHPTRPRSAASKVMLLNYIRQISAWNPLIPLYFQRDACRTESITALSDAIPVDWCDPTPLPILIISATIVCAKHVDYDDEVDNLKLTYGRIYYRALTNMAPKKNSLLEIGCGNGFFLEEALKGGYASVCGVKAPRGCSSPIWPICPFSYFL